MAVGASGEDSNATLIGGDETNNSGSNDGCVRIYYLNPATSAWEYQTYIKRHTSLSSGRQFGARLAFNEDATVLAVGNSEIAAGAQKVLVYTRTGVGTWAYRGNCVPSSPTSDLSDGFGLGAIDCYGDVVVVSANSEDGSGTGVNPTPDNSSSSTGCAYVFRWNGSAYVQEAYIKAQTNDSGLEFGRTLALYQNTLVVGVNAGTTLAREKVEVFDYNGSNWQYTTTLTASNAEVDDIFGAAVDIYEDFIIVGARVEDGSGTGINPASNNSATGAGAAYLFKRTAGVWAQTAYIKASNTASNDNFGGPVRIYNGKILIGANGEDSNATGLNGNESNNSASASGAAYLFTYNPTTGIPTQTHYIKIPVGTPSSTNVLFASTENRSATLGDNIVVFGNGLEDSLASTTGIQYTPTTGGSDTGAVYVYNI
jgi:hypothetical protein